MPRTLNPETHAVRRDAFVEAAQNLIQTKGYEQLSIQDVLDELDASKGAFYHYFDSKVDLLEAVVERMVENALTVMEPVVADTSLTALQKMHDVFSTLAQWKNDRRALVIALIEVWMPDDNAIVREKLRQGTLIRIAPLLSSIVQQGTAEGTFSTSSPDATARVLISLIQGASEVATELFLARKAGTVTFDAVERTLAAYTDAYERILGLTPGSWSIIDEVTLHLWYD